MNEIVICPATRAEGPRRRPDAQECAPFAVLCVLAQYQRTLRVHLSPASYL